jgi:hypothetical protein
MTEALPVSQEIETRPPCAGSVLDLIFDPHYATAIMTSGEGGTGKTHSAIDMAHFMATKLHIYILTNGLFLQKTRSDFREVNRPHDRVRHINTMRDLWYEYALICKEHKAQHPHQLAGPIVVALLDEWTKYMRRLAIYEKVVLATLMWWGEIRKYQLIPWTITQKMSNAPRQLLPYMKWHIQKSEELTREYNAAKGTSYHYKELGFVIRIKLEDELEKRTEQEFYLNDVAGVMQFRRGPDTWTGAIGTAKVGQICYDPKGSANFLMGKVNGSEDWFEDFMKHISSCPGMMVPDKILEFFDSDTKQASALDTVRPVDVAKHIYRQHREAMDPEDTGHPMIMLGTKDRKRVRVPLNPTNMERIFKCPHTSLARELEKET